MKLSVLSDNRQLEKALEFEHGLCIYLETEKYKCLLDTGASDIFIHNAEKMVIDLVDVDYVFISHGHSDHTGGLKSFLKINTKAKIILSEYSLSQHFVSIRDKQKDISCTIDINDYPNRFQFINAETIIENDIHVFPCQKGQFPLPRANNSLMTEDVHGLKPDDFKHELIICFGNENIITYTGCAHNGILNILNTVENRIGKNTSILIGGFHLPDGYPGQFETESEITEIAESLVTNYPETIFYTGHCTGKNVFSLLKKKLGNKLKLFHTGYTLFIHNP